MTAKSPLYSNGFMLMPSVIEYVVVPPSLVGAKKIHTPKRTAAAAMMHAIFARYDLMSPCRPPRLNPENAGVVMRTLSAPPHPIPRLVGACHLAAATGRRRPSRLSTVLP